MGERTNEVAGSSQTRDIRNEIEQTQRDMSRTIDEIQHRLSPNYMMQRTKESIREAGVKTSRSVVDRIRENPIPAAMVGMGLYLLMRGDKNQINDNFKMAPDWNRNREDFSSVAEYRDFNYEGGGAIAGARDRVSGAVSNAREQAGEAMDSARDMTRDAIHGAADGAHHLGEMARRRALMAQSQGRDFLTANPLMAGVAALAFGAIIGAIIPESDKENELMGQTRDRFAERAKDTAREGMDRARDIATAATSAATDAAKTTAKATAPRTPQKTDVAQNVGLGPTTRTI